MTVSPDDRLAYHQLHRGGRPGLWRPLVGVGVAALGALALAPLVWQQVFLLGFIVSGATGDEAGRMLDLADVTPVVLAYVGLVLASAIPVVWFVSRVLHGLGLRWVTSVAGGVRWRFFLVCLGLAVAALAARLVVSALLPQGSAGEGTGSGLNDFTSTTRDFLLVIAFLIPMQAAGEEYLFRGYLTQAVGGLSASRAVAVVVPALLFGLAHGAQDLPLFLDRFGFGLVAGVLVIATGGLEAAVAMHVLNNIVAFGLALAFSDITSALTATDSSWWSIPGTLTQSLVYLWLALSVARRSDLQTVVPRGVLEGSGGRVYRSALRRKGPPEGP